jgi:TRAP-type mannitol/chloroaromatic compound transport system permease small subunit
LRDLRPWIDRLVGAIDTLSERTGRLISWFLLLLITIGAFNAIARYSGRSLGVDLSSNAYLELQWYLFAAVFLLGGGYTLKHRAHVRVDVLYERISPRARGIVDLVGTLVLLIPFCVFVIWISWSPVWSSIELGEQSPDPGGLPRFLVKPLIPIGFAMLMLQGIAETIRRRRAAEPPEEEVRL